jgi:hypothetical protein
MRVSVLAAAFAVVALVGSVTSIEIESSVRPSITHPSTLRSCGPLCDLDLPGVIAYQGYPVEHHSVVPADGYVLATL